MCGVIKNNVGFATLQMVTSQGSKRPVSHYVYNIAGGYKGTKSHRGRDAAGSGISQRSISDVVSVVSTVPPTGDVSVPGHYQEEHGKYKVLLNREM
jgi:hypothetical protein